MAAKKKAKKTKKTTKKVTKEVSKKPKFQTTLTDENGDEYRLWTYFETEKERETEAIRVLEGCGWIVKSIPDKTFGKRFSIFANENENKPYPGCKDLVLIQLEEQALHHQDYWSEEYTKYVKDTIGLNLADS